MGVRDDGCVLRFVTGRGRGSGRGCEGCEEENVLRTLVSSSRAALPMTTIAEPKSARFANACTRKTVTEINVSQLERSFCEE